MPYDSSQKQVRTLLRRKFRISFWAEMKPCEFFLNQQINAVFESEEYQFAVNNANESTPSRYSS